MIVFLPEQDVLRMVVRKSYSEHGIMIEVTEQTKYNVVIRSIGTASPVVSQVLSKGLGLPSEMVVRALYNAPAVLFREVDEELAGNALELLQHLGLETEVVKKGEALPQSPSSVDVGVYIHDALRLPHVCRQLTEFMGCSAQEALNLLCAQPCLVLGGVSPATADALAARLDAEVFVSNPKEGSYRLFIYDGPDVLKRQLYGYLEKEGLIRKNEQPGIVSGINYAQGQELWRKYHAHDLIKLVNEAFLRKEIVLHEVDTGNPEYAATLIEMTGMPESVVEDVIAELPVQLESSVNPAVAEHRLRLYAAAGLKCHAETLPFGNYTLIVHSGADSSKAGTILQQILPKEKLPDKSGYWECPVPLGELMARYIAGQLEMTGCEVEFEPSVL